MDETRLAYRHRFFVIGMASVFTFGPHHSPSWAGPGATLADAGIIGLGRRSLVMSAFCPKRTCACALLMSAFRGKGDTFSRSDCGTVIFQQFIGFKHRLG